MSEVPIVVGLLHGFDGTAHWLNHVLIDRYDPRGVEDRETRTTRRRYSFVA